MKFTNHLKSEDADCYLCVPGSVPPPLHLGKWMYIPITISCVNVVDDVLSAAEESKCILYKPALSHDHSSNYELL